MRLALPYHFSCLVITMSFLNACGDPAGPRRAVPVADQPPAVALPTEVTPTDDATHSRMPDLAAYPVDRRLGGPFIQPDPSDIDQGDFRLVDAIRFEGEPLVPNCAGHFHAMVVGCGTHCLRLCFFDLRDGRLVPELEVIYSCTMSTWIDDPRETYLPDFDVDSRVVMIPCIVGDVEGSHFFEIVDRSLVPLASFPWNSSWNRPNRTDVPEQ